VTLYSSRITEYVFSSDAFWPLGCAFWLYRVAGLFRKVRHIWKSKPKIAYLIWFVPWAVVVLVSGQLPVVGAEKANRIFLQKSRWCAFRLLMIVLWRPNWTTCKRQLQSRTYARDVRRRFNPTLQHVSPRNLPWDADQSLLSEPKF